MNKNFLYITSIAVSSLLALSACSDESGVVDNNTNEGKTTIDLNVGMAGAAATRAITELPDPANLSTLPTGTTLFMVMKSEVDAQTKWTMTKAVTGTVTDKKSAVAFSVDGTPRYWDDCGARDAMVSVYSICTPGGTPNTPTIGGKSQYAFTGTPSTGAWSDAYTPSALTISNWTVQTDQAALNATTFADQDLCYSNNVTKYSETEDHRLKFNNTTSGKFDKGDLVFYHALTKVTVNMTAGDGFEAADSKKAFQSPATATIHDFQVQGDFDIPTGVVTPKGAYVDNITTFMTNDDKTGTEEVVTRSAIIMPGRTLAASDKILTVDGDGSTYNVTAAELVAAMPEGDKVMQQGTEYIINVRISKTGIKVAATIADWKNVEGTNYSPLINFTQSYGAEGTDFGKGFSLYLSQNAGVDASLEDNFAKGTDVSYAASKYTLVTPLYWPNHQKHYLFRGVWPLVGAATDGTQTPSTNVEAKKIAVANVAYAKDSYPSDLMLGYPRKAGETCESHGKDVTTLGICATEGSIAMNFQYVMSQVEVNLSTSEAANKVIFDERTTVEIIGGYYDGFFLFKNGASDFTDKTTGDYGMHKEGDTNKKFHDAVIPQSLEGLKFRITVTDSEGKSDKYETVLGIKEIEVTPSGGSARKIDTWEPGKKYIYNLYITKTGIKVTATLTDWITVTADENVWF